MSEEISRRRAEADETPEARDAAAAEEASDLAAARREAEENWNKYVLAAADLDNLRRRAERELANARKYGVESLAQALLPVRDSLEAGITAAQDEHGPLLEGMQATLRLLDQALEGVGIRTIEPLNEAFDPNRHEAIGVRSADVEPHTVVDVVQKGYEIHDRLLRPARVIVSQ